MNRRGEPTGRTDGENRRGQTTSYMNRQTNRPKPTGTDHFIKLPRDLSLPDEPTGTDHFITDEPTGTDHFIKLPRDLSLRQMPYTVAEEVSDRDFFEIQDFGT
jgi:hypothetical protein